jgi:hypothetical protein
MTDRVNVRVELRVEAPAEDTNFRIVMFRDNYWRVYNARNIVMTTCETRDEAAAWIARQPEELP